MLTGGGGGHAGPNGLHMDTNISIIIYNAPAMQLMYISGSLPLAIIDKFNAYFHIVCMQ